MIAYTSLVRGLEFHAYWTTPVPRRPMDYITAAVRASLLPIMQVHASQNLDYSIVRLQQLAAHYYLLEGCKIIRRYEVMLLDPKNT